MSTTRDVDAVRAARQRRQRRALRPSGPPCAGCGNPMVQALADAGETLHATCGPEFPELRAAADKAAAAFHDYTAAADPRRTA